MISGLLFPVFRMMPMKETNLNNLLRLTEPLNATKGSPVLWEYIPYKEAGIEYLIKQDD